MPCPRLQNRTVLYFKIANKSFENVAKLKYFGKNKNWVFEKLKEQINFGECMLLCCSSFHLVSETQEKYNFTSYYGCDILSLKARMQDWACLRIW